MATLSPEPRQEGPREPHCIRAVRGSDGARSSVRGSGGSPGGAVYSSSTHPWLPRGWAALTGCLGPRQVRSEGPQEPNSTLATMRPRESFGTLATRLRRLWAECRVLRNADGRLQPTWSKAVKSATLEAARLGPRGGGWAPSGLGHPLGVPGCPRAARRALRRHRGRARALPRWALCPCCTTGRSAQAPYMLTCTKRLALSVCVPSEGHSLVAQIEREAL